MALPGMPLGQGQDQGGGQGQGVLTPRLDKEKMTGLSSKLALKASPASYSLTTGKLPLGLYGVGLCH